MNHKHFKELIDEMSTEAQERAKKKANLIITELSNKDKKADARLRKKYGISLEEYNQMLASQGGVCKICKNRPLHIRLSVDHDHRYDKIKIKVTKIEHDFGIVYSANCIDFLGRHREYTRRDKQEAKNQLRLFLKRLSIRGLCCFQCNKGLQYYRDKPERLESAANYLREYKAKINETDSNTSNSNISMPASKSSDVSR